MAKYGKFNVKKNMDALMAQQRVLPTQIANHAQQFFVSSFTKQGFTDNAFKKWKEVKRRIPGTPAYEYPKSKDLARRRRAILLGKTRNLLREVNNSKRVATWALIKLGISDAAFYAKYINEGTDKMPARKFMGSSTVLDNQIREKIRKGVLSSLKK